MEYDADIALAQGTDTSGKRTNKASVDSKELAQKLQQLDFEARARGAREEQPSGLTSGSKTRGMQI